MAFFPSAHKDVSGEVRSYLPRLQDHQEIMKNLTETKQNGLYQDQHFFNPKRPINAFVSACEDSKTRPSKAMTNLVTSLKTVSRGSPDSTNFGLPGNRTIEKLY